MRRWVCTILLLVVGLVPVGALELKTPAGTITLRQRTAEGTTWVCASQLAEALHGTFARDAVSAYPVLTLSGHRILISTATPVASIDGNLIHLSHIPKEDGGCLWLPEEFLTSALSKALGGGVRVVDSAPTERPSMSGPLAAPAEGRMAERVGVDLAVGADYARVTLTGEGLSHAQLRQEGQELVVLLARGSFAETHREVGKGILEKLNAQGATLRLALGAGFERFETLKLLKPERLVILLKGKEQTVAAPPSPIQQPAPPGGEGATQVPSAPPVRTQAFDVIAIDPGHGGTDTGALGPDGLEEKDLTLAIATKFASDLEKQGLKAVLTRTSDVTVPLQQRTALANFNQADLFISIHINSAPTAKAHGTETYYLSKQATDLWSSQLADKENAAGGTESSAPAGGLNLVLWDLAQTSHIVESAALAETIQDEFNTLLGTQNRGVRQAPFVVLEGAQMPAVLVEVAFLSNPSEAKKLSESTFQDQVANALTQAVLRFKARYENPNLAAPQP
jgi:N-acetylmuramoyl-L-alanine amidase